MKPLKSVLLVLLLSPLAQAQDYSSDPSHADLNSLRQNGKLVSIKINPKSPIRIFVVGREEAKFDITKLKLFVKRLTPTAEENVMTLREGDHFVIPEKPDWEYPTDLEVTAEATGKKEKFLFKLKNAPGL